MYVNVSHKKQIAIFWPKFSVNFIHQKLMEEEEGRPAKVFETRNGLMARAHLFMQGSGGGAASLIKKKHAT